VSIGSFKLTSATFLDNRSFTSVTRCFNVRPKRSNFQMTSTSPLRNPLITVSNTGLSVFAPLTTSLCIVLHPFF